MFNFTIHKSIFCVVVVEHWLKQITIFDSSDKRTSKFGAAAGDLIPLFLLRFYFSAIFLPPNPLSSISIKKKKIFLIFPLILISNLDLIYFNLVEFSTYSSSLVTGLECLVPETLEHL